MFIRVTAKYSKQIVLVNADHVERVWAHDDGTASITFSSGKTLDVEEPFALIVPCLNIVVPD